MTETTASPTPSPTPTSTPTPLPTISPEATPAPPGIPIVNKTEAGAEYGFHFDQSSCTGCKACQVACVDKHDLPEGVLWRRVVEYSGGSWQQSGNTVTPNIFTYYTSVACNHCADPICMSVCPTTAMSRREDGTVYVDDSVCVGCRYCEWACPYSAPQFNAETGHMSKCDLCHDSRSEGKEPACVASCPSRALDWGPIDVLREEHGTEDATAPLPDPSITSPHLVITPHRDAQPWDGGTGRIANPSEI